MRIRLLIFYRAGVHVHKPRFLFHGSKVDVTELLPHKACGLPEEFGTEYGVYAYESFDMARRFALPIMPTANGSMAIHFDEHTGDINIKVGTLDKNSFGYVYKVPAENFVRLDDYQWISPVAVTPIEKTKVFTMDLWDKIKFG